MLAGDIQLNPGPGLADTPADNATTGLLPHLREEFPALDTNDLSNSTPSGAPAGFRTLTTSENGAWDLNIQLHDDMRTTEQAEKPAHAHERLTEAAKAMGNKLGLTNTLDRSADSTVGQNTAVLAKVRPLHTQALTKQRQTLFFQTVNRAKVVWDPMVKTKRYFGRSFKH